MKWLLTIGFLVSVISCTRSIPLTVPLYSNRIESPEISKGLFNLNAGMSLVELNNVVLAADLGDHNPLLETPHLQNDGLFPWPSLYVGVPIFPRFELSLDTWHGLKFRYQILGNSRGESKVGELLSAVSLGYNFIDTEIVEKSLFSWDSDFDSTSYNWAYTSYSGEIIFGGRIHDNILIYGGPFYSTYDFKGRLYQYKDPLLSETTVAYSLNDKGQQSGLGFSFEYLIRADIAEQSFTYNVSFTKIKWGDYTSDILVNHGVIVKYYFKALFR